MWRNVWKTAAENNGNVGEGEGRWRKSEGTNIEKVSKKILVCIVVFDKQIDPLLNLCVSFLLPLFTLFFLPLFLSVPRMRSDTDRSCWSSSYVPCVNETVRKKERRKERNSEILREWWWWWVEGEAAALSSAVVASNKCCCVRHVRKFSTLNPFFPSPSFLLNRGKKWRWCLPPPSLYYKVTNCLPILNNIQKERKKMKKGSRWDWCSLSNAITPRSGHGFHLFLNPLSFQLFPSSVIQDDLRSDSEKKPPQSSFSITASFWSYTKERREREREQNRTMIGEMENGIGMEKEMRWNGSYVSILVLNLFGSCNDHKVRRRKREKRMRINKSSSCWSCLTLPRFWRLHLLVFFCAISCSSHKMREKRKRREEEREMERWNTLWWWDEEMEFAARSSFLTHSIKHDGADGESIEQQYYILRREERERNVLNKRRRGFLVSAVLLSLSLSLSLSEPGFTFNSFSFIPRYITLLSRGGEGSGRRIWSLLSMMWCDVEWE